jgi:hypothetical protein
VRVADFQIYELLAGIFRLDSCGCIFDGGTESDTDETENRAVAFAYAEDVVLEVGAGCT